MERRMVPPVRLLLCTVVILSAVCAGSARMLRGQSECVPLPLRNYTTCDNDLELSALESIFNATDGPHWLSQSKGNASWLSSNNYCQWHGVTCLQGCVARIHLQSMNLIGVLPDVFDFFPNLQTLILSTNLINGDVPPSLGNCSYLNSLDLSFNYLQGAVPESLGRLNQMVCLDLSDNNLGGEMPQWVVQMPLLQELSLEDNYFNGGVPDLSSIRRLEYVRLGNNEIDSWTVTAEGGIALPAGIAILDLSSNNITGPMPDNIGDFTQLVQLDFSDNNMTGIVPLSFAQLINMEHLVLADNCFQGDLFDPNAGYDLANMTSLQYLDVSFNYFSGILGPALVDLIAVSAEFVDISNNEFVGVIPEFRRSTSLVSLNLCCQSYGLNGTIPNSLLQLEALTFLDLSMNVLTGTLEAVSGLSQIPLATLNLNSNYLGGYLSELDPLFEGSPTHPSQAAAYNLRVLTLSYNNFAGPIDDSLCKAQFLILIDLSYNNLINALPNCIRALNNLQSANFEGNPGMHAQMIGNVSIMPSFLKPSFVVHTTSNTTEPVHYQCPEWMGTTSGSTPTTISLDPQYYNFSYCRCLVHFVGTNGNCRDCPAASICNGGMLFNITPGVWLTPDPYSDGAVALNCRNSSLMQNPCIGIQVNVSAISQYGVDVNFPCAEGYTGRLCSTCQSGYFARGTMCLHCETVYKWLLPLFYVVGGVALMGLCVSLSGTGSSPESLVSIAIFYVQSLALMKSVYSITWSYSLLTFFDLLSPFNFEILGGECVASGVDYSSTFAYTMVTPLLFVGLTFISLLGQVLWHKIAPGHQFTFSSHIRSWTMRSAYVLLFFLAMNYINVAQEVLMVLDCNEDPVTGVPYLRSHPSVPCNTVSFSRMHIAAWFILVLYLIGVPLLFLGLLVHFRNRLYMPHIYSTLGFFYSSYRPAYYWWEVVIFLRKFALTASIFITPDHSYLGPLCVFLTLQVSIVLQVWLHPFNTPRQNTVELASLYTLVATYLGGLVVQVPWVTSTGGEKLSDILLVLNICCMAYMLFAVLTASPKSRLRMIIRSLEEGFVDWMDTRTRALRRWQQKKGSTSGRTEYISSTTKKTPRPRPRASSGYGSEDDDEEGDANGPLISSGHPDSSYTTFGGQSAKNQQQYE